MSTGTVEYEKTSLLCQMYCLNKQFQWSTKKYKLSLYYIFVFQSAAFSSGKDKAMFITEFNCHNINAPNSSSITHLTCWCLVRRPSFNLAFKEDKPTGSDVFPQLLTTSTVTCQKTENLCSICPEITPSCIRLSLESHCITFQMIPVSFSL